MEQGYKRDPNTQALLNSDSAGLEAYQTTRARLNKIADLENNINTVKDEVLELKKLLLKIFPELKG